MLDRTQIKAKYPIAEYLTARGVELKRAGGEFIGLCPFHDDKNPSLSVDLAKGVFFCHACGKKGSVIDLEMEFEGISQAEAMKS